MIRTAVARARVRPFPGPAMSGVNYWAAKILTFTGVVVPTV